MENQSWHQNRKIQDDSVKTEHRDNTVVIIRDKSLYKPTKIGFWNDRENPSFIFPNVLEYHFKKTGRSRLINGVFRHRTASFLHKKIVGISVNLTVMWRSRSQLG